MKKLFYGAAALALLTGFASMVVSCGSSSSPSSPAATATPTPSAPTATPTNTPIPTAPAYKTSVGNYYNPEGVAFSPSGTTAYALYDNTAGGVTFFNSSFTATGGLTTYGATSLTFATEAIQVDPNSGDFYILDENAKKIYEYTATGSTVNSIGSFGAASFSSLSDIAIAPTGNLYLADAGAQEIYVYNSAGATINSWIPSGIDPVAVAVSPVSPYNVYVGGSASTNHVVEYSSTGSAIVTFGGTASSAGVGQGQFEVIDRLAVSSNGNVYVSDGENGSNKDDFVQEFSPSGTYLTQWGGNGSSTGQFIIPGEICFNAGDIYVADANNNRIQVFGP